jgi:hypothetical protein
MPREEAEILLREKFPDLYPKSGGVTGALGRGVESTLSSLRTGIAGLFDAEQAAKDAALRERSIASRYADEVGLEQLRKRYEQEGLLGGAKEVLGVQAPRAIAEQIPQVGVSLGGAFGGARLGAAAGAVFGPVGAGIGAAVGGTAGAFAPSFLQQLYKQGLRLRQVRLFWANNLLVSSSADLLKKHLKRKLAKHLLSKA